MSAHSDIGPSSAERWMACPASVPMSAKCPKPPTSYAAAEGTVAHKFAEWLVREEKDELELMTMLGDTVHQDGHEVTIIEEMVEGARVYRDLIVAERKALEKGSTATVHALAEQRVQVASVDPKLWGTSDYLLFRKGHRLLVIDYKFGQGKTVSAEENPQATLYALGAMETVAGEAFDEVELIIVQPRGAGSKVKRWVAPRKWLFEFREKAKSAIAEARGPNPRIVAGGHCRWCPAQAMCPEVAKKVEEAVQADFAALAPTETEIKAGDLKGLPDVRTLSVQKLAQVLDWEDAIEAFLGAVRARVGDLLAGGQEVPGYKLVDGRSNRKWADDTGDAAAQFFSVKYGHRVYAPRKALSVAQMEKLVGKDKIPAEFIVKPEAPKKVAPNDDPRPVASTTAQQDFDPMALPGPEAQDPTAEPVEAAGREPFWPQ